MQTERNGIKYRWDDNKNEINRKKHNIDFETAIRVFADPNAIDLYDRNHSDEEERYIIIGMIDTKMVLITVVYTPRDDAYRIISAREANAAERRAYNVSNQNS